MAEKDNIEKLKEKVAKDPASKLFVPLADEYKKAGMPDKAIEVLKTGLAKQPGYMSARVALGKIYLEKGMKLEAKEEFEKVVTAIPDNLFAQRKLADVLRELGDAENALARYKTVLRLNPLDEEAMLFAKDIETKASIEEVKETALAAEEMPPAEEALPETEAAVEEALPPQPQPQPQIEEELPEMPVEGIPSLEELEAGAIESPVVPSEKEEETLSTFTTAAAFETPFEEAKEEPTFFEIPEGEAAINLPDIDLHADGTIEFIHPPDEEPISMEEAEKMLQSAALLEAEEPIETVSEESHEEAELPEELFSSLSEAVLPELGALEVPPLESPAMPEPEPEPFAELAAEMAVPEAEAMPAGKPALKPAAKKVQPFEKPRQEAPKGKGPDMAMADSFISSNNYYEAIKIYREMLEADPKNKLVLQRLHELKALLKMLGKDKEMLISKLDTFLGAIKKRGNEFFRNT